MKAAVFSDTHSNVEPMLEAVRRCCPDVLIHLGDHDRDAEELRREFPHIPLYNVCGNCDLAAIAPLRDTVPLGPIKALICHGHAYDVNRRLDSLVYAAQEEGAKLALFGHTHVALQRDMGGVLCVNPGTAGKGSRLTWALIEVYDNGGISCSINEL